MFLSFSLAWQKAFDFKGKTTRRDFWLYQLVDFVLVISLVICRAVLINLTYFAMPFDRSQSTLNFQILSIINSTFSICYLLFILGNLIVEFSIIVRRLRDASIHWLWIFINVIPFFGNLYFLYLLCQPSKISKSSGESNSF